MASIERQIRLVESVAGPFGMRLRQSGEHGARRRAGRHGLRSAAVAAAGRVDGRHAGPRRDQSQRRPGVAERRRWWWFARSCRRPRSAAITLDLEVVVPPHNDTTSIAGGWLMETRLKEKALVGRRSSQRPCAGDRRRPDCWSIRPARTTKPSLLRGRVLGGGKVSHNRSLGLMIQPDEKSVFLSKQIGDAVNRRFHSYSHGVQQGVATPKTDAYIELLLHPRYKYNMPRYMRVVPSIAIQESPEEQAGRLKLLEKQLLDPVTSSTAALRLEAVGKEGIPVLQTGLKLSDPEVRFYSAEALAYLDDASAAKVLGETARNQPAFRAHALTAMSALNDVESADELRAAAWMFPAPKRATAPSEPCGR